MRIIKLRDYNTESMQLAKPIYDNHRRVLLAANNKIHPKYLDKMLELGISFVIVEDAESKGITLEEMLDMPTWMEAIQSLQEIIKQFASKKVSIVQLNQLVGQLLKEVISRKAIILSPSTSLGQDLQPYAHAINVALLSLQVGKQLGYNELQLRDLGVGSLLHDIGKFFEKDEAKHPEVGFNLLRGVREISLLSAHIAYQHHEALDGSGYPRGIKGLEIIEYAQVCGLANLYDNLISIKKMLPHEAFEIIMALSDLAFSNMIVDAFVKKIPAYPPGTKVVLNNNEEYIVTKIEDHMQRPTIRHIASGKEISMAEDLTLFISGCLV